MRRFSACFLAFSFLLGISGCSCDQQSPPPPPPTPTPAQVFDETHGGKTHTPYGDVLAGTAQDMTDGTIQYQTADGPYWKVMPLRNGEYGHLVRLERVLEAITIVSEIIAEKEQDPSVVLLGGTAFAVPPAAVPNLKGLPAGSLLKTDHALLGQWGRAEVPPGFVDECGPAAVATERRVVFPVTNGKETTARTFVSRRYVSCYFAEDPRN
jgi:hypothetical protein